MRSVLEIAAAVHAGHQTAVSMVDESLTAISAATHLNAVTTIHEERARTKAAEIDARIVEGMAPSPLAGVPFAAKNLFDVAGEITRAGSRCTDNDKPSIQDAFAIRALENAGAILVASTNMDELAYGFSGENVHDGDTHNPHGNDLSAGGSSSGSAALVATGAVPFALGTDTNGSVRVPAALSGVAGLKPTYGKISRSGVYPFVQSLDHVGWFGVNSDDLNIILNCLDQVDTDDPVQVSPPIPAFISQSLQCARLGGYFESYLDPDVSAVTDEAAKALGANTTLELTLAEKARAAAFLITNAEAGQRHFKGLTHQPDTFGPLVRERLRAGALIPALWIEKAQRLRRLVIDELARLHQQVDLLIAPATPCPAFPLGAETWEVAGTELPIRLAIGMYTQPLTLSGVPIGVAVKRGNHSKLPVGVQLIGRPFAEKTVLKAMKQLENVGFSLLFNGQEGNNG